MRNEMRAALAAIAALLTASPLMASGLWLYEDGSPTAATAAAGRYAIASDASTAFHNPAGMTRLDESELLVGVTMLLPSIEFSPGPGTNVLGGDGGDAGDLIPGLGVFYVHAINEKMRFGISAGGLGGGGFDYDDDWVGRYYLTEAGLTVLAVSPSFAYRVNDRFSIGGGPVLAWGELWQEAAVNNALDVLPDGHLEYKDDEFGFGAQLGILIEPSDRARFGFTYYSEISSEYESTIDFEGLGPGLETLLANRGLLGANVTMDVDWPMAAFFSWYVEPNDRLALMGNLGWQNWEEFGLIDVGVESDGSTASTTNSLEFEDTLHVAIGLHAQINDVWKLMAGLAWDESPVEDEHRSPIFPFDEQWRVALGLERELLSGNRLGFSLTYLDLGNAALDVTRGPLSGTLQGDYGTNRLVTAGFNYAWGR